MTQQPDIKAFISVVKFSFQPNTSPAFEFFFFLNEPIIFHPAVSKTFSRLKTGWVLSVAEASITSSGKIWITDFTE